MRLLVRAVRSALLLMAILVAALAPAKAEPRLALVIANSAYAGGLDPLANPVNDGKLVAATLTKLGFKVTLVSDIDQKGMKRAISEFGDALGAGGPTTTALFYFAGHGLQVDGQNYLVPINAAINKEADVDLEAVSAETVLKQMEYAAPSTSIVILDACRNNPLSRGFRSASRGLARMDAPNGSYVAYSTAPGQTAADGTGRNSPFAAALVSEMVKPGQGIEEAFRNVRINVAKATNGEQTPWDSSSLMNSFYFAGEKQVAAVAAAPEPAPAPIAAPAAATIDAAEAAFWDSIKDSNRAGDYAAYLKKYPQGTFAELAQSRQDELQAQMASRAAAATTPAPTTLPAATPAATQPEEEFESPLADGTIVLSRDVTAKLAHYLSLTKNQTATSISAYFFAAENGRGAGQAQCMYNNLGSAAGFSVCPDGLRSSATNTRMRSSAKQSCEAAGEGACVMLYAGDSEKAAYKLLD